MRMISSSVAIANTRQDRPDSVWADCGHEEAAIKNMKNYKARKWVDRVYPINYNLWQP